MRNVVCDKCGKKIEHWNFGRKWLRFEDGEHIVMVKAGHKTDPFIPGLDFCIDCVVAIAKGAQKPKEQ